MDTPTGSTSAEYTSNGVVLNVIPREGGNRFGGTLFASGTNHNLQDCAPLGNAQGQRSFAIARWYQAQNFLGCAHD